MNRFGLPIHLFVEEGAYHRIPEVAEDILADIANHRSLVLTQDQAADKFSDVIDTVTQAFPLAEVQHAESAIYKDAVALAGYITGGDIRMIFAFGDTDLLNLAKYAGYISQVPVISVVMTLDSDSAFSPVAVLRAEEGGPRKSYNCAVPAAVLVDLDIVSQAEEIELKCGAAEVISKLSALYDWHLAESRGHDRVEDFACMMIETAVNSLASAAGEESLKEKNACARLAQALIMCGLSVQVAGTHAPAAGSEHTFAYALENHYASQVKIPRGIAAAMGAYASAVFQDRSVETFCQMIKAFGIQIKPSAWKVDKELFAGTWLKAAPTRPDRYTILYETHLNEERLHEIYDEMELVL